VADSTVAVIHKPAAVQQPNLVDYARARATFSWDDARAEHHDEDLQQALDLDSMDFLNVLIALGRTTGVEIPESDYGRVRTFTACVNYLSGRVR
jgi:acyl carrier protein